MKLIICDDCIEDLQSVKNLIQKSTVLMKIPTTIECYLTGENLLLNYEEWLHQASAIFLDIRLSSMNGIDLAKFIRSLGYSGELIFFSNSNTYIFDIFEVEPLEYLLKEDININKITNTIKKIYRSSLLNCMNTFYYNIGKIQYFVLLKKVIMFEVNKRIIKMYVINEKNSYKSIQFYSTLEAVEDQLKTSTFARAHKSFIINFNFIQKMANQETTMYCNLKVPIGRKYKDVLHRKFCNYLEENDDNILIYEEG